MLTSRKNVSASGSRGYPTQSSSRFCLLGQKTTTEDTRSRMVEVSDWEPTEGGFRRSEMNGFSWIFLDSISGTEGYTSYF